MTKGWSSLLIVAGLATFPIAMQSILSSYQTYVSGNPFLQIGKHCQPLRFQGAARSPKRVGNMVPSMPQGNAGSRPAQASS